MFVLSHSTRHTHYRSHSLGAHFSVYAEHCYRNNGQLRYLPIFVSAENISRFVPFSFCRCRRRRFYSLRNEERKKLKAEINTQIQFYVTIQEHHVTLFKKKTLRSWKQKTNTRRNASAAPPPPTTIILFKKKGKLTKLQISYPTDSRAEFNSSFKPL